MGKLSVKIPWSSLKSSPVEIVIEDLLVLACPSALPEFSAAELEAWFEELKQKRLAAFLAEVCVCVCVTLGCEDKHLSYHTPLGCPLILPYPMM